MSSIAIITARGGSKRIPHKNIKNFMGKPMLAYAIEAALKAGIFDTVMVSTDCEEIAQVARKYGAEVPFMRSAKSASDYATTYDVIDEVITEYQKLGKTFENLCCIYPCVPFLQAATLQTAFKSWGSHDALQPVCKYSVPIEWAMKINAQGVLIPNDRAAQNKRSQDLEPKYYDVGMFYFCKTSKIHENRSLTPNDTVAYVIDENECQDIDTPQDWAMAEMKYKVLHGI